MNFVPLWTLTYKELKRFIRVPYQTIASPIITTFLYFAVFGFAIGSKVGEIHGLSYKQFIMPGLIMMNVLTISYTGLSSGLMLAKITNTLTDILITPMSYLEIILGYVISSVVRSVFVGFLIYITALFFVGFRVDHPLYLLSFVTLVSFAFSLFGLITGIWAENFEQITLVPTFLLTPLTFLGGVFYSVTMLPPLFRNISQFNPVLYMINGMRYGFYGISDINPWIAYLIVLVLTVVLMAFTWYLFKIGYKIKT